MFGHFLAMIYLLSVEFGLVPNTHVLGDDFEYLLSSYFMSRFGSWQNRDE